MLDTIVRSENVQWEPAHGYPPGSERKVLLRGPDGEVRTMLLRLPRGFRIDRHSHLWTEHHYVLDGTIEIEGQVLRRGHYQVIGPHTSHGPFLSDTGAEVLVLWT